MKALLALGITAALAASSASAEVQITGFGQIVAGTVTSGDSFPGTGYDDTWDFKDESLFAVQIRGDLNEQWSATAQLVARGNDDFDPEFAWAYVGWNGGNGWSAKLGRQRIPFFRYSDFLEVGYAYPWLRPPEAVYFLQFSNFDGGSLSYNFGSGDWYSGLTVFGGEQGSTITLSGLPADLGLKSLVGVYGETVYADWLTLRAAYVSADVIIDAEALNPLFSSLNANGFRNVTAAIDFNEDPGTFIGLGAEINKGNWQFIGEYTEVTVDDSYYTEKSNFYVTGGYRLGAWTPTVTYGQREGDPKLGIVNLLPNVPPLAPLRGAVTGVIRSDALDDQFWSYGLRWDVATNVALKADFTQYIDDARANGDRDALAFGVTFTF